MEKESFMTSTPGPPSPGPSLSHVRDRGGREEEDLDSVRTHRPEPHDPHEGQAPRPTAHVLTLHSLQG
jgi:hypothetical protein